LEVVAQAVDHLGLSEEKAVLMRVIGRPHDLVRADGQALLDRLERNPAIALEDFARPVLRPGSFKP
jgi:hypothetical protein